MSTGLQSGIRARAGGVALAGNALRELEALDRCFVALARELGAEEIQFPPLLPVEDLRRAGYLSAFPHLTMLATHVAEDQHVEFAARPCNRLGEVEPRWCAPATLALVPAACTPLYPHLRGETVIRPRVITTRNTCFRQESRVTPLQRQRCFTMRELVVIGRPRDVGAILDRARAQLDDLVRAQEIAARWQPACDPFFAGESSSASTVQRLAGSKQELVVGPDLAIGSANRHGDHFGTAFEITTGSGPAHSACLAVGLERWLHALHSRAALPGEVDHA